MPWMIFYQQSAVLDKQLGPADLKVARIDTAVGAVRHPVVMAAVLIATARHDPPGHPNASLTTVQQIAHAITPFLGDSGRAAGVRRRHERRGAGGDGRRLPDRRLGRRRGGRLQALAGAPSARGALVLRHLHVCLVAAACWSPPASTWSTSPWAWR